MPFSPEQGFEQMRKAADGAPEAIVMAEVENLKNDTLEAGANLTAQTHEEKPTVPEVKTKKDAPAQHWLADWEAEQEKQNDRRHESFDHDGNK